MKVWQITLVVAILIASLAACGGEATAVPEQETGSEAPIESVVEAQNPTAVPVATGESEAETGEGPGMLPTVEIADDGGEADRDCSIIKAKRGRRGIEPTSSLGVPEPEEAARFLADTIAAVLEGHTHVGSCPNVSMTFEHR